MYNKLSFIILLLSVILFQTIDVQAAPPPAIELPEIKISEIGPKSYDLKIIQQYLIARKANANNFKKLCDAIKSIINESKKKPSGPRRVY
jgi:hypothetical protein